MTDPAIRDPIVFLSEFKFFLREISQEITLRLYRPLHSEKVLVRRSHYIAVSGLDAAEKAACEESEYEDEGGALHRAVIGMVCVYNAARAQGLTPDISWLKPNADFC